MSLRLNRPTNANGQQRYQQGIYQIQNPHKYIGDINDCKYRSSWEKKFCTYCDLNPKVKRWGSEVSKVPYIGYDNNKHVYHIDFYVEIEDETETGKKMLVEVKPSTECKPPKKPNRITAKSLESYEYSLKMYQKNILKWQAARQYALDRGMQFVIVNENHLAKLS